MKTMMLGLLAATLLACSGAVDHAGPDAAPCEATEPAPTTPAADAAAPDVAVSDAHGCRYPGMMDLDSVSPAAVTIDETAGTRPLITFRGCGFTGVRDVQVNVYSVQFVVVDDATIVATIPVEWKRSDFALPITVKVDILKQQPDQVQIDLVLR